MKRLKICFDEENGVYHFKVSLGDEVLFDTTITGNLGIEGAISTLAGVTSSLLAKINAVLAEGEGEVGVILEAHSSQFVSRQGLLYAQSMFPMLVEHLTRLNGGFVPPRPGFDLNLAGQSVSPAPDHPVYGPEGQLSAEELATLLYPPK